MKKIFAVLLIFSHLFATVGLSIGMHECGGQQSYKLYNYTFGEACTCYHATETQDDDCCKDKRIEVKPIIKDKLQTKVFVLKTKLQPLAFVNAVNYNLVPISAVQPLLVVLLDKYPPRYLPPLYILHRQFLI